MVKSVQDRHTQANVWAVSSFSAILIAFVMMCFAINGADLLPGAMPARSYSWGAKLAARALLAGTIIPAGVGYVGMVWAATRKFTWLVWALGALAALSLLVYAPVAMYLCLAVLF